MEPNYEDTVLNFDLNLFCHDTSNPNIQPQNKYSKQRKAITLFKKKLIATNTLIEKYYDRKTILENTERELIVSKDECKKICLDYRESMEKLKKLESNEATLKTEIHDLEQKFLDSENHCKAIQSYSNQLQELVKEKDLEIDGLKNKISSLKVKSSIKETERKLSSAVKENKSLLQHIHMFVSLIVSKKKLNSQQREILNKYKRKIKDENGEIKSDDEMSSCEDNFDSPVMSPLRFDSPKELANKIDHSIGLNILSEIKEHNPPIINRDEDSDSSNGPTSEDTGRGSSLECSNSDKCFSSPDYFTVDSPVYLETNKEKNFGNNLSVATSPIMFYETAHKATSPIIFFEPLIPHINKVDAATSPIIDTNTLAINFVDQATSPIQNSSYVAIDEKHDFEIQYILNEMKLQEQLSPLAPSPYRDIDENSKDRNQPCSCSDIVALKESNEILNSRLVCVENVITKLLNNTNNKKTDNSFLNVDANFHKEHKKGCVNLDVTTAIKFDKTKTNAVAPLEVFSDACKKHPYEEIDNNKNILSYKNEDLLNDFEQRNKISRPINKNSKSKKIIMKNCPPNRRIKELGKIHQSLKNNTLINKITHPKTSILKNEPREEIVPKEVENDIILQKIKFEDSSLSIEKKIQEVNSDIKKIKSKKLTKLQRIRKKLIPSNKIPQVESKTEKRQLRSRIISIPSPKVSKIISHESYVSLNEKSIYEKAVSVMAEIKKDNRKKLDICKNQVNANSKDINTKSQKEQLENETPNNTNLKKNSSPNKSKEDNECVKVRIEIEKCDSPVKRNAKRPSSNDLITASPKLPKIENMKEEYSETNGESHVIQKRTLRNRSVIYNVKSEDQSESILNSYIPSHKKNVVSLESAVDMTEKEQTKSTLSIQEASNHPNKANAERVSVKYDDVEMFTDCNTTNLIGDEITVKQQSCVQKSSILLTMIEKYAKHKGPNYNKKLPENIMIPIFTQLNENLLTITKLHQDKKTIAMEKLVENLRSHNPKCFVSVLLKYMMEPDRRTELFNKIVSPPAPDMTKNEQILLFVIKELDHHWSRVNLIDLILNSIEYALFKLNSTPSFEAIESCSHFYAVLCRYFSKENRLRTFVLDAMYCLQYKSITLITQCLEVWMHIIPLAHMKIAKTPLVTCLVYLLHFFKCKDQMNKVQNLRYLLLKKYCYKMSDWNEMKILKVFKASILQLKDVSAEKKTLRMSLIILAKRHGPKWCQQHIIRNMLEPLSDDPKVPQHVRDFCVAMLGPLLKPYPLEMKVHCEITVNKLLDMLDKNPSDESQEAIMTSLLYLSKQNNVNVVRALIMWKPQHVSPELEKLLKDFVQRRPLKSWTAFLSKIRLDCGENSH